MSAPLTVSCPRCGAHSGERCTNESGADRLAHREREAAERDYLARELESTTRAFNTALHANAENVREFEAAWSALDALYEHKGQGAAREQHVSLAKAIRSPVRLHRRRGARGRTRRATARGDRAPRQRGLHLQSQLPTGLFLPRVRVRGLT